jgi:hypothetical protein
MDQFDKAAEDGVLSWGEIGKLAASAIGAIQKATDSASGVSRALNTALVGAGMGAKIGGMFGPIGAGIGAAVGAIGGAIFGALHKPGWVKESEAVGKKWGVAISKELAKQIEEDSKRLGSSVAAQLVNLPKIIEEAGGIGAFGADKATTALGDMVAEVESGKLSVAEAGKAFDDVFGQLAPEAINKTTGMASKAFTDLIQHAKAAGIESKAMEQFLADQTTKLGTALEAVAKGAVITANSAGGVGAAVAAEFEQLRASGMSAKDALDQMQPTIDALTAKFAAAGVSGGAAFTSLAAQSALLHDEVAGPLMEAILGAGDAIVALANSGALTQETFGGLTAAIGDTYAQLTAQGQSGPAALALMQPSLQAIWEAEQRFGYAADAGTQALVNQAVASGEVGAAHESAAERMVAATQRVADILAAVAQAMGVTIPEAAAAGAAGVQSAFDGVSINIPVNGANIPDVGAPAAPEANPGGNPDLPSFATGGIGDFGRGSLAVLHGREAIIPLDGGGTVGGLGGSTINIYPSFEDNPLQTYEARQQLREHTVKTLYREASRDLASAVAAGGA